MARNRSVDFLPEIFKTDTNKEFLNSTLDQLTQEPKLKQTQGYVGKKYGHGIESDDNYVLEPTVERDNYQLEPGIIFKDGNNNTDEAITYPEIIDALHTKGADTTRHDRLFSSPIYSWSPLVDFDKIINHNQYYWLPGGTASVNVSSSDVLLTNNFDISNGENETYKVSGISGLNPTITLVRGGEYTFTTSQPGHGFYIQTEPGTSGVMSHASNISSRDVLGVTNNGEDGGVIKFTVPKVNAQQFYYDLTSIDNIDLATYARFDSINGKLVSQLKDIDGIVDLNGKTIVFLDSTSGNSADLGWQYLDLHEDAPFESEPFEETTFIDSQADRYSVYQIQYTVVNNESVIKLVKIKAVSNHQKFKIEYGTEYSNKSFYKNSSGFFQEIPSLTATFDTLYYQDSVDATRFGIINIVESTSNPKLNINDILGKTKYTSPNGVEFSNGMKIILRGDVSPIEYKDNEYYVEGVGTAIKLIKVSDLITPETFNSSTLEPFDASPFDSTRYDSDLNSPTTMDFITINRGSNDLNPWSRSNRWVHIDVIKKTAEYNKTDVVLDNNFRANRPIIEYDMNLRLFNFGTEQKKPITSIDFVETDAFSNVNGQTTYSIDSFNLTDGNRVIFANDTNADVKNKIFDVHFVDVLGDGVYKIDLVEASDGLSLKDQSAVCTNGATSQGKTYHFNGESWVESQQKTSVNSHPLFDVFDANGFSYSDTTVYPYTTFSGTKMFSYAVGTGANDSVLGFPIKYLNIDNLGDIVFDNNFYSDTFKYKFIPVTVKVSDGTIRKYSTRTDFNKEVGWTEFVDDGRQSQIFKFEYDGNSLILDVVPSTNITTPSIKVLKGGDIIKSSEYTTTVSSDKTTIKFTNTYAVGTEFIVHIVSDQISKVGYYEIPKNLESNTLNDNILTLTLGTIRNHCNSISQNLNIVGESNGANNLRDLGQIAKYGNIIIQNSSPIAPMAKFLHSQRFDFFESLDFNANAYEKIKLKIIKYITDYDTYGLLPSKILDNALTFINVGKSSSSPFYKSDMLAGSGTPLETSYEYSSISTNTFNTSKIYDFSKANNSALLVYLNDKIIIKDVDYTVSIDSTTIDVIKTLKTGDIIKIKEYESTVGSYIPNTPSKLGTYPKFQPKKYLDDTALNPSNVIQGHDGSIMVAFDDVRDDVLLEFETRIYNNIKINSIIPLLDVDVIPGKFRNTDYDAETIAKILSTDFLNWVGWHRLDYSSQDYVADNELTWNYSTCGNKISTAPMKGHWRGVYIDFYDTDTPHTTPWKMLGFSEKPSWWENEYGGLPYTSGNMVLWDDLEAGLIKEPNNNRIDTRYKRAGLSSIIPVDSLGQLLNPFVSIVTNYSRPDFRKSWVVGDYGPVENAWRKSSSYPWAVQRLLALTKPAQYFSMNIDRDRYVFDSGMNQYMYDGRYKLDIRTVEIQSDIQPKHSYINWIADYYNNNGCSCADIYDELKEVDVRLCYRMASFTDKSYLKIYTDKSSPNSINEGLLLPDQSYELVLHKNEPRSQIQYSSVIVQKTDDGYAVYGHGSSLQYFEILRSVAGGANKSKTTVGGVPVSDNFNNSVTVVPYGYVFTNRGSLVDFLVSYGAFLTSRGLIFNSMENNNTLDWYRIVDEFIEWSNQEWGTGSIVNLNPCATELQFNKELVVVDDILNDGNQIIDQNGISLEPSDYDIVRLDNNFKVSTINGKNINFLKFKTTGYEHLMVLDNVSIFNDLIYQPITGLRQQRVRLVGFTTFGWNGQLDAQGFILNQDNVKEWEANKFYTNGSIVKFKNLYWSAVKKLNPSNTFDFNDWVEIDYDDIKKGLIPNASNKARQISEYYNKKTANLESDVDLLAMGLTGFRPRSYLTSLDDVSQVNFYSEFINSKGTNSSINVFDGVNFNKKITNYDIYENWAVMESAYGGSGNTSFIDLELNDNKAQSNPTIVEVINDDSKQVSNHNLIKISDIYNQQKIHTNTNIYPTTPMNGGTTLPSAGNVHTDDVDIALFEISDLNGVSGASFTSTIASGTTIWVAKDSMYDWNVYRADTHPNIHTITATDGVLEVSFYASHEFVVSDTIVIQGIDVKVNGAYNVENVMSTTAIRISNTQTDTFTNISTDSSSVTTDTKLYSADHTFGFVYKLTSVRTADIDGFNDSYFVQLPIGSRAWVDSNRSGKSATYQKYNNPSDITSDETSPTSDSTIYTTDGYGVWAMIREEQDKVNVDLIKGVSLYNKETRETKIDLDYIDPVNNKHLGVVNSNIDYISSLNPAVFNSSSETNGILWGDSHVGDIWWDTTNIRFLEYNQENNVYSSDNWGGLFPGSKVEVKQWVKSLKHPTHYDGDGTVNVDEFTTVSTINSSNTIVQHYYYWVSNSTSVASNKTLSTDLISRYINNPLSSGIMYVSFLNSSSVAIHNAQSEFDSNNSILHIVYKNSYDETPVFNEFNLIKANKENNFLSDGVYRKLQNSFIGGNTLGLAVPDITLNNAEKLGLSVRPRQSMFKNRLNALKVYLSEVNAILKKHIIVHNKSFDLLTKSEIAPAKASGEWNVNVSNLSELQHQNITIVPEGYKYLVTTDSNNLGGWSIYDVFNSKLRLIRIQKYDTTRAWSYINWYEDSDAETAIPLHLVSDTSKLSTLNVENNTYVKVSTNSTGKFEIYQLRDGFWIRVGLEDGTIEFSNKLWSGESNYDNTSVDTTLFSVDSYVQTADEGVGGDELRNIIRAINEEILVNDLASFKNKLLISIFEYILSEQNDVEWLHKTSLVDVEHTVRDLEQYPTFKRDDQDFLLNYLQEAKPYHTKIKEFLLKYNGTDQYNVDSSDFDCPVYFDDTFNKFISPVLDYEGVVLSTDQSNFDDNGVGLVEPDYNIWELSPWDNWYKNRGLSLSEVKIQNGGTGYISAPTATVIGESTETAIATVRINGVGNIIGIDVINGGDGYMDTPTIQLSGGSGSGAVVLPIMSNPLVRTVKTTLKYDRCSYTSSVVEWVDDMDLVTVDSFKITADEYVKTADSGFYDVGQLVRFNNKIYVLNVSKGFDSSFKISDYTLIDSSTLDYVYDNDNSKFVSPVPSELPSPRYDAVLKVGGVDSTMGYYVPDVNNYGLDINLLIGGTSYGGVEIDGLPLDSSSNTVDVEYSSIFADLYAGTRPIEINSDGGEFVDTYSSHAPEELLPGSVFDTLDIVVNTRPGFDYHGNGHSFESVYKMFEYTPSTTTFKFIDIVAHPIAIAVVNSQRGKLLINNVDYTVNWASGTVSIIGNASDGEDIQVIVYEIGGGNQLYRGTFNGSDVGNKLQIPVASDSIYSILVHVNGVKLASGFTSTSDGKITVDSILETADSQATTVDSVSEDKRSTTTITFNSTYTSTDFIAITVFGFEATQHEFSYPMTKNVVGNAASFDLSSGADAISVAGKNAQNAMVHLDGIRLRPPEAIRYVSDGTTLVYRLPENGGIDHATIASGDIIVYGNNSLLEINVEYAITTTVVSGTTYKDVVFGVSPAVDVNIDIYVTTSSDYDITGNNLTINGSITRNAASKISITTWNDVSQMDVLTNVFKGPGNSASSTIELFDSYGFDIQMFDSFQNTTTSSNIFDLNRTIINGNRLIVTKNGRMLLHGADYAMAGKKLLLTGEVISPTDVIAVTSMTDNVVPDELSFRLFKDMNGNSIMCKAGNNIKITKNVGVLDDRIYVNDVSELTIPNLELGIFGIVVINGERITYREHNATDNYVGGLRRGTGGTGIRPNHVIGSIVNNIGEGAIVDGTIIKSSSNTFGSETNIYATTHDKIWYSGGTNTISDGISLQNQTTNQALFLKK